MIAGVVHTLDETVYRVEKPRVADLFDALADAHVNVDTIIQIGPEVVFSAPREDHGETRGVLDRLGVLWTETDDLAKVSVVGAGMKSHPGVAARTFSTLRELGVEPRFISTSPIKIAFYVPRDDVERAVVALHETFDLSTATAERAHV